MVINSYGSTILILIWYQSHKGMENFECSDFQGFDLQFRDAKNCDWQNPFQTLIYEEPANFDQIKFRSSKHQFHD